MFSYEVINQYTINIITREGERKKNITPPPRFNMEGHSIKNVPYLFLFVLCEIQKSPVVIIVQINSVLQSAGILICNTT